MSYLLYFRFLSLNLLCVWGSHMYQVNLVIVSCKPVSCRLILRLAKRTLNYRGEKWGVFLPYNINPHLERCPEKPSLRQACQTSKCFPLYFAQDAIVIMWACSLLILESFYFILKYIFIDFIEEAREQKR